MKRWENNMKHWKGIVIISIGLLVGIGLATKSSAEEEDFCAAMGAACRTDGGTDTECLEFPLNEDLCADPLNPEDYDEACKNIGEPGTCDVEKLVVGHECLCP